MPVTFNKIASVAVGSGGTASIDFSSIPQTYTDLCIKISARTNRATPQDSFRITLNATNASYSYARLYSDGSAGPGADVSSGDSYLTGGYTNGNTGTANTFGSTEVYFSNYTTSSNKSVISDGVSENNATTAYVGLVAASWSNSAAITSIKLESATGATILQHSTATLYGISKS